MLLRLWNTIGLILNGFIAVVQTVADLWSFANANNVLDIILETTFSSFIGCYN